MFGSALSLKARDAKVLHHEDLDGCCTWFGCIAATDTCHDQVSGHFSWTMQMILMKNFHYVKLEPFQSQQNICSDIGAGAAAHVEGGDSSQTGGHEEFRIYIRAQNCSQHLWCFESIRTAKVL